MRPDIFLPGCFSLVVTVVTQVFVPCWSPVVGVVCVGVWPGRGGGRAGTRGAE